MNILLFLIIALLIFGGFLKILAWGISSGVIVVAVIAWLIAIYNKFIQFKNRVSEAWSDIEVQMKRRYNLIPNLVASVKGYAGHEKEVFQKVTQARTMAMGAQTMGEHAQSENMLTGALKSLFAVSEAYPDLKANTNFLELQKELTDTEDKIQAARRFYNGNVRDMNIMTQSFPSNVVAKIFSFDKKEFFELDETESAAKKPVEVKF